HLVGVERLAQARVDLVEAPEQRSGLGHALEDIAAHVLAGIESGLLGKIADASAVGGPRLTEQVRVHSRHDAEERAPAGAARAEHADLGAGKEREPEAPQDFPLGRDDLAKILHRVYVLARPTPSM